jgi:hypothetical protein
MSGQIMLRKVPVMGTQRIARNERKTLDRCERVSILFLYPSEYLSLI